jgi:hypothetical protein
MPRGVNDHCSTGLTHTQCERHNDWAPSGKNANCGPGSSEKNHIPAGRATEALGSLFLVCGHLSHSRRTSNGSAAPNAWRCSALAGTTSRFLPDGLAVDPARS